MEREVYGRLPQDAAQGDMDRSSVTDKEFVGLHAGDRASKLIGHVDNSAYPAINVNIAMTLVMPANAKGPVPVLMMFGRSALPAPAQPPPDELDTINAALQALLVAERSVAEGASSMKYPAYSPIASQALIPFTGPRSGRAGAAPAIRQRRNSCIADGWGYACIDPGEHSGR